MRTILRIILLLAILSCGVLLWKKTAPNHPAKNWLRKQALTVDIALSGGTEKKLDKLHEELTGKRKTLQEFTRQTNDIEETTPVCLYSNLRRVIITDDPQTELRKEIHLLEDKIRTINARKRARK